ncbi:MAG: hypothetical protein JRE56_02740 [Deltaproteobacteria bacterium]|jgi:hypothetical protein|nr:hypothetical protein [Deltaproteobacteria bacterium]MBW2512472.1 hypothetical protein [Deltaproteobacteria bacterium]
MNGIYFLTNKHFLKLIISIGIFFLLSACGGGGGGDSDTQSDELPLELGLDGPGDTGGYFPLEVGNLWVFRGTSFSSSGSLDYYHNTISINKTKNIDGFDALVLEETNSYGEGVFESYIFKDLNGIANLGSSDEGALGVQISKYWEVRFPLVVGESFVQLDRTGLNLGEDLDDDDINDSFNIRSVVKVIGFTTKTVPVGTFNDVVHIRRNLNLDFILSSSPDKSATAQEDAYFAPDIGFLERSLSVTIDGVTENLLEQLAAYLVNGQPSGLNQVTNSVIADQVDLEEEVYYLFDVFSETDQTVSMAGLTGNADLIPILPGNCKQGYTIRPDTYPEDCQITSTSNRVIFAVNGLESSEYVLSIAQTPNVLFPIDEGLSNAPRLIEQNIPTVGKVGTGVSYYNSTDLSYGNHLVSISGLNADADLGVYSDETYSTELGCILNLPGGFDNSPKDCIVENVTELYFRVESGGVGASYIILAKRVIY